MAGLAMPAAAQDLGFLNSVFARVSHLTLYLHSADPRQASILDRSGAGCITLPLCGAGTEVLIDLDTRSDRIDLELGFGAGYLRPIRSRSAADVDIRGSLRSLPVVSTHVTYLATGWLQPYFTGSFGLVDIWNGRVHTAGGKQSELRASTFEYGVSAGVRIAPSFTNARLMLEAGHRSRNFSSVGYTLSDALPSAFPREINLSTWQLSAGWQFDLRPIGKSPVWDGLWVLTRVDGLPLPTSVRQERSGTESTREEIVSAYLDLRQREGRYTLDLVRRTTVLAANGAPLTQRVDGTQREDGQLLTPDRRGIVLATPADSSRGVKVDDELMLQHASSGLRLFFKKVRRG